MQIFPRFLLTCYVLLSVSAFADVAFVNANGYTSSDTGLSRFSVLIVADDGRIIATGDDSILAANREIERRDLGGKTVLPGLIDAHAHVSGLGFLRTNLNLTGVPSLADTTTAIANFADQKPHARWITGSGWNQVLWPDKKFPLASDIDGVVSDKPVWLHRIDGHAGWANTLALELAGIDDDTPDPVGGKILRDDNGHATGVLIDRAMSRIDDIVPKTNSNELREAIKAAVEELASQGITSVHDAGIDLMHANVYLSMADNAELDVRIYAMTAGAGAVLEAIGKPIRGYGGDHLDIAAVKLVADGALGSRGAAMIEPYSDDEENRGLPFWTQQELTQQVEKANRLGFQVGIHAIGDLGNRMALDAFDHVQGGSTSPLRNRIEHAQIISLEDIPRFAKLGVIAAMQTTHATSDMNMAEDRVGPTRIRGAYAWRSLLNSGTTIANGSDFPVELANPFFGLHAAVTRQGRDGEPKGGWYANEAMTKAEALHSFTFAAAYAAHQEDRLGSLESGKWADFIVVDRDYFEIPSAEIDDIGVLATYVAGKLVYEAKPMGESQ